MTKDTLIRYSLSTALTFVSVVASLLLVEVEKGTAINSAVLVLATRGALKIILESMIPYGTRG